MPVIVSLNQFISRIRLGFTIAEMALVLIIAGVTLASVWAVTSMVWQNYQIYKVNRQILTIVQNIRDYYGPMGLHTTACATLPHKSYLPNCSGQDIRADLIQAGLIPLEMLTPVGCNPAAPTTCTGIDHEMQSMVGGSLLLNAQNSEGDVLRMRLQGLTDAECRKLLMNFPILMPEARVRYIGTTSAAANNVVFYPENIAFPLRINNSPLNKLTQLDLATVGPWCNAGGISNVVDIRFWMDR